MGSILTALYNIRNWGQHTPHVHSHCDCDCSNDSSSSSSEERERHHRKQTTWLERHRPGSKKPGATPSSHPAKGKKHKSTQTKGQ